MLAVMRRVEGQGGEARSLATEQLRHREHTRVGLRVGARTVFVRGLECRHECSLAELLLFKFIFAPGGFAEGGCADQILGAGEMSDELAERAHSGCRAERIIGFLYLLR